MVDVISGIVPNSLSLHAKHPIVLPDCRFITSMYASFSQLKSGCGFVCMRVNVNYNVGH